MDIELIHSSPRHPSTNGVVERVHQNIRKALLAKKIEKKNLYDIRIAIAEAENSQNSCRHNTTKYIPKEIFNNKDETINNNIRQNMISSQKNVNKNLNKIENGSYIIMSNVYIKQGKKLNIKFNSIGVGNIPGIVVDNKSFQTYKIKILINFNDLLVNNIYEVNYKLVKLTSKEVCDKLIKDYENNEEIIKFEFNTKNINISEKQHYEENNISGNCDQFYCSNNKNFIKKELDSENNEDGLKKFNINNNTGNKIFKKEIKENNDINLELEEINNLNKDIIFDEEDNFFDDLDNLFK